MGETRAYYNEIDRHAAAWLRELIKQGHIAAGDVDERSIEDVEPEDLLEYTQCHFFAGIGVWSYALRQAGWPDDRTVWTGSCPCQPFSAAGKGKGFTDDRHLWPAFHWLISQCRPVVTFGEQVAGKAGETWLDLVSTDLENEGYAVGAAVTAACGFGAPHQRKRIYWVADSISNRQPQRGDAERGNGTDEKTETGRKGNGGSGYTKKRGSTSSLVNANGTRCEEARESEKPNGRRGMPSPGCGTGVVANADSNGRGTRGNDYARDDGRQLDATSTDGGLADSDGRDAGTEREQRCGERINAQQPALERNGEADRPGPTNGQWRAADWLGCTDGKWRPVEPGTFPLAHGASQRVGRLRGYGNAIVAPQAAAFIESFLEVERDRILNNDE